MPLYLNGKEVIESPVETIEYVGDDAASQSIAGLGFQPTMVEITRYSSPLKSVISGVGSRIYDPTGPDWRATVDGEHLTIDSDGFTIEKDGGGKE